MRECVVQDDTHLYLSLKKKIYICPIPSFRNFPNFVFETMAVTVIDSSPIFFFQSRLLTAAIHIAEGVMVLVLCPKIVSQAPQHLNS